MERISKNRLKSLQSYKMKKFRDKDNLFIAQGSKCVLDLMPYFNAIVVVITEQWLENHTVVVLDGAECLIASEEQMSQITTLSSAPDIYALFEKKGADSVDIEAGGDRLYLALDSIQDPGNMGTIIRIADWFGVRDIFASFDTADVYNPKVVQSTMGSLARVRVHYQPLGEVIERCREIGMPVYGTFLDGESLYSTPLARSAMVVMGNEGKGISAEVEALITDKILIPSYPPGAPTCDSLNVATATAIICNEFRRKG